MARAMGLAGWHSMRKDELVRALVKHARATWTFVTGDRALLQLDRALDFVADRSAVGSAGFQPTRYSLGFPLTE